MLAIESFITVAIAAAVTVVMALSGAFSTVGKEVENATARVRSLQAALDKLHGGQEISKKDVTSVLTPEEKKAYEAAKTPEELKAVMLPAALRAKGR